MDKAEITLSKRLDAMNEFREALKDQTHRMATREQLDALRDRVFQVERPWTFSTLVSVIVSAVVAFLIAFLTRVGP
jgi:hypothetical protein